MYGHWQNMDKRFVIHKMMHSEMDGLWLLEWSVKWKFRRLFSIYNINAHFPTNTIYFIHSFIRMYCACVRVCLCECVFVCHPKGRLITSEWKHSSAWSNHYPQHKITLYCSYNDIQFWSVFPKSELSQLHNRWIFLGIWNLLFVLSFFLFFLPSPTESVARI